jgi:hypothetical protein
MRKSGPRYERPSRPEDILPVSGWARGTDLSTYGEDGVLYIGYLRDEETGLLRARIKRPSAAGTPEVWLSRYDATICNPHYAWVAVGDTTLRLVGCSVDSHICTLAGTRESNVLVGQIVCDDWLVVDYGEESDSGGERAALAPYLGARITSVWEPPEELPATFPPPHEEFDTD